MSYPEFKEALEEYGRVAAVVAAAPDGDFSTRILAARWRVMEEVSRVLDEEKPGRGAVAFLVDAVKDAIGRLDAAHAALSFYAEPMNYVSESGYDPSPAPVKADHGERARKALRVMRNADPGPRYGPLRTTPHEIRELVREATAEAFAQMPMGDTRLNADVVGRKLDAIVMNRLMAMPR